MCLLLELESNIGPALGYVLAQQRRVSTIVAVVTIVTIVSVTD